MNERDSSWLRDFDDQNGGRRIDDSYERRTLSIRIDALSQAQEQMKEKVDKSFEMTEELLALVKTTKLLLNVIKYVGLFLTPVVSIATAWHFFFPGGK